ncbi:hypothetical protein SpCBS45565_g06715 [Spizellomyces sp. 'palustris']|nr:hypothetical protein SpCBS45565_g06715 [Spizellomyces sp. 'palustris']
MRILYQSSLLRLEGCILRCFNGFVWIAGPAFILIAVALVSLVAYVFYTVNLPFLFPTSQISAGVDEIPSPLQRLSRLATVIWTIYLLSCLAFHYYMCIVTDPGRVVDRPRAIANDTELDRREDMVLFEVRTEPVQEQRIPLNRDNQEGAPKGRFCKKCRRHKPDRAHHCSVCQRCVLRMDHHCPFSIPSVGFYNHRYFYLFLLYMFLACLYYFVVSINFFRYEVLGSGGFKWPYSQARMGFVFSFLLAGAIGLAICGMAGWHTWLIATGQTTIEHYGNQTSKEIAKSRGDVRHV